MLIFSRVRVALPSWPLLWPLRASVLDGTGKGRTMMTFIAATLSGTETEISREACEDESKIGGRTGRWQLEVGFRDWVLST
ncbi:hypothetical protein BHE74_00028860 [Ensete ventricosum]|nr:hypothetical protein BHE74_00028860 [Ensete ventricosum]RZR93527.1 hypothetical protein BHM03_00022052 [Ensete ventricosum]